MFSSVLKDVTGFVERRFLLTFFLPSLLFWAALALVFGLNTGLANWITLWERQTFVSKAVSIAAALTWITFFAYLVSNQMVWLTQLFEGYWDGFLFGLGKVVRQLRAKQYYQKVLSSLDLDNEDDYAEIYYRFPLPGQSKHIMPTRLGNILKNTELYPKQRYNLDAVIAWPRLYAVLPELHTKTLADAKASLDLMLVIATLSAGFTFLASVYLLIAGGAWALFGIVFVVGILLVWLGYESAIRTSLVYSEVVKSTFDIFRGELIAKLGYARPNELNETRVKEEENLWRKWAQWIYRGSFSDQTTVQTPPQASPPITSQTTPVLPGPPLSRPLDLQKFILVLMLIVFGGVSSVYLRGREPQPLAISVPARALPAYHQVSGSDLMMAHTLPVDLPQGALMDEGQLIGTYLREALAAGKPITTGQVVSYTGPGLVPTSTVVGLTVSAGVAMNGKLSPGDLVAVWQTPADTTQPAVRLLERALVLDLSAINTVSGAASSSAMVVVLVVPVDHEAELIAASSRSLLTLVPVS